MSCATCKFWDLEGDRLRRSAVRYVERPTGYGFCLLTEEPEDQGLTDQEAFAVDASEYSACLITSPKFSCSHFQEKIPSPDSDTDLDELLRVYIEGSESDYDRQIAEARAAGLSIPPVDSMRKAARSGMRAVLERVRYLKARHG